MKTPLRPSTPIAARLTRAVAGNERRRRRSFWQFYREASFRSGLPRVEESLTEHSSR